MQNAKEAYLQRKAEKVAKKQREREEFKAAQATKARNELEENTRKPEDVEIDLDAVSSTLGSLYHQKEIVDYELKNQTREYSNLLVEYHKSKEVWKSEKPEGIVSPIAQELKDAEANDVQPKT